VVIVAMPSTCQDFIVMEIPLSLGMPSGNAHAESRQSAHYQNRQGRSHNDSTAVIKAADVMVGL